MLRSVCLKENANFKGILKIKIKQKTSNKSRLAEPLRVKYYLWDTLKERRKEKKKHVLGEKMHKGSP